MLFYVLKCTGVCAHMHDVRAVKIGLLLLFLAHIRFDELFVGGGQSPMVRPYPQMFLFLSSAVTERRRLLDNVCQIKLQKLRESPRLPKSLLVVPRVFFERQQFNTGYSRLACDLLEDAIQIAQQSQSQCVYPRKRERAFSTRLCFHQQAALLVSHHILWHTPWVPAM